MNARPVQAAAALRVRDAADSTQGGTARVLAGAAFDCVEATPVTLASEPALAAVCSLRRDTSCRAGAHDVIATFESVTSRQWSKTPNVGPALSTGFATVRELGWAGMSVRGAFAAVMIHDGAAHVAAYGAPGMFVLRRGLLHVTDVVSAASGRSQYLKHRLYRDDRIVLTCDRVARAVRSRDVRRIVMASSALDAACERLLDATPDGGAIVLIVQLEGSLPSARMNDPLHFETPSTTIHDEGKRKDE